MPGAGAWLAQASALLLGLLLLAVEAADKSKFRTCEQVGFCK